MPDDLSWFSTLAGRFLVFEGPDGSGKTTQFRRFVREAQAQGLTVCEVREPGGTDVGEQIRRILLDHAHKDMSLRCEMMLYMASRAELVEQKILPALRDRCLVVADRFVPSTIAYQGAAGGLPLEEIRAVADVATRGCSPDLVLVFDVEEAAAARRLSPILDRMEAKGREFHRKVRQGYLDQIAADPERYRRVDANGSEEQVWQELVGTLRRWAAATV